MYDDHLAALIVISGIAYSLLKRKLSAGAAFTGGFLSTIIYLGAGLGSLVQLTLFFVLGTLASGLNFREKTILGINEGNNGKRTMFQVLANAGIPAIFALLALYFSDLNNLLILMLSAGFSSACSDTLSSEIGNAYGKRFYNILTFKPDVRGLDGVVSIEGSLCGLAGSFLIGLTYSVFYGFSLNLTIIVIAGTIGNLADSILGATLERKGILTNNAVNACNTLLASLSVLLFKTA